MQASQLTTNTVPILHCKSRVKLCEGTIGTSPHRYLEMTMSPPTLCINPLWENSQHLKTVYFMLVGWCRVKVDEVDTKPTPLLPIQDWQLLTDRKGTACHYRHQRISAFLERRVSHFYLPHTQTIPVRDPGGDHDICMSGLQCCPLNYKITISILTITAIEILL